MSNSDTKPKRLTLAQKEQQAKEAQEKLELATSQAEARKMACEFTKIWVEQSKLMWGRLQTAAALHTAIFIGWYQLDAKSYNALATGILVLGFLLAALIIGIMRRDCVYMDEILVRTGDVFRKIEDAKDKERWKPGGRHLGMATVAIPMVAQLILIWDSICPT